MPEQHTKTVHRGHDTVFYLIGTVVNERPKSVYLLVAAKLDTHHVGVVFLAKARGQNHHTGGRTIVLPCCFCRSSGFVACCRFRRVSCFCAGQTGGRSCKLHLHLLSRVGKRIQHDIPVRRNVASVDLCDAVTCLQSCLLSRAAFHNPG